MILIYIWFLSGLLNATIILYQLSKADDPMSRALKAYPNIQLVMVVLCALFGTLGLAVVLWEILADAVSWVGNWWMRNIGIITIRVSWNPRRIDIKRVVYEPDDL